MGRVSKEVVDEISPEKQSSCLCKKCHTNFVFKPEETWWNEQGTYSVKLVKCSCCGTINPVQYVDAPGLYVNYDKRYF